MSRPSPVGLRRLACRAGVVCALVAAALAAFTVASLAVLPGVAQATDDPVVGMLETFRVSDWGSDEVFDLYARVSYVGDDVVIYVQKGRPVPDAFVADLGTGFDDEVYPRLTTLLGSEPDPGVDGQGRVVLLLYDFGDPRIDGYFDPRDIDPVGSGDTGSNRREMFALNLEALLPDAAQAAAASAHEFAHLLLYYRDYMLDSSPQRTYEGLEARWVEESIAMYAELAAGYPDRSADPLRSFSHTPNENLTIWRDFMNDYGASYAFATYLAERFGQGIITELVAQPLDGVAGIEAVLQARGAFDTLGSLFDDWVVANVLEGRPPETPPYAYAALDFVTELSTVGGPLPRVGVATIENYGALYLDLPATEATATARAVLDGEDGAPLHVALVSWDSTGRVAPTVTPLVLAMGTAGGTATSPAGYDRHTLALWARGQEGMNANFDVKYSLTIDPDGDIQFLDVGSDHLYFPYIDDLLSRGVISGKETPPGSGLWYFRSGDGVLRAQFAKMAVEAVGLHTEPVENLDAPTFPDVPPRYDGLGMPLPYPFDYVEEAVAADIVGGYSNGRFGPWEPIKRIQLARMILRAAAAAGHPFTPYAGSEVVFADIRPGDPLYADAMTAYSNGILDGSRDPRTGVRRFLPWTTATRGQVAKMTANLIWGLEGSSGAE